MGEVAHRGQTKGLADQGMQRCSLVRGAEQRGARIALLTKTKKHSRLVAKLLEQLCKHRGAVRWEIAVVVLAQQAHIAIDA